MPRFINILLLLFLSLQVNALVADRAQVARYVRAHNAVAKHKRSPSSCVPRPTSSLPNTTPTDTPTPSPTDTPTPTPTDAPTPTDTSTTPPTSTTPSATSSTPAPSPTNGNNGSRKWGLAFGADPSVLQNFDLSKVGYIYNWSPTSPSGIPSGMTFVPMLWGYDQTSSFPAAVTGTYGGIALGPNEPNEPSQSNLTPQQGMDLWMQYINPLKQQGYTLVSPACTNDDAGLQWYQQFMQLCKQTSGCHVDIMAFHGYVTDAQAVISYATTLHTTYGLPVWITEFADQNYSGTGGQDDMDQVWNYAGAIRTFIDSTSWLTAAFPFGIMSDLQGVNTNNALMDSNGYPTDLAYFYFS